MHVTKVALRNFRSYECSEITLDPGINIIVGNNGQGKTNFIEAVALLSIGRSVRGATDAHMVRWQAEQGSVICQLGDSASTKIEMVLQARERKQIFVDGAALGNLSELIGMVRTVHMTPDTIDQSFRSAAGRRRMLDMLISQVDRQYLNNLRRHRQIVQSLNALYKQPDAAVDELSAWEQHLAVTAVEVMLRRADAVDEINRAAVRRFAELFENTQFELRMRCTLPIDSSDPVQASVDCLAESRSGALRNGYLTRGAHRDQLDVIIGGRDMESHASQGQMKGAYYAWKVAEGDFIATCSGDQPVWLVDDPFSEMDRTRSLRLLDLFGGFGQVIVTSARDDDLGLMNRGLPAWQVEEGTLRRI